MEVHHLPTHSYQQGWDDYQPGALLLAASPTLTSCLQDYLALPAGVAHPACMLAAQAAVACLNWATHWELAAQLLSHTE
jgi:hypothetical protein